MKMPFVELTWKNLAKTLAKKYFPGKFKKSSHSKHFPRGLSSRKPLPQMEQSDQDDFDMCLLSSTDSDSELPQSMPTPKPKRRSRVSSISPDFHKKGKREQRNQLIIHCH